MKLVIAIALLLFGASSLAAQRFAEDSAPLQDPEVSSFMVFGDVALAIDYQGRNKVTAFINAYSLSKHTFLWHQEVQVQRTDEAVGRYAMPDYERNLLYLGNGPLTLLDVATGQVRWSLPCNQVGTVDLATAQLVGDGNFLISGTKDCGNDDDRQVMLIDDRTGAIRWRATARALEYKVGQAKHVEFRWFPLSANGQITRIVLAGDKLAAVNYADGSPAWAVRNDVGRVVDQRGDLMYFVEDKKLTAYRLSDGTVAWALDVDAPWVHVEPVPGSSDVVYFTYYAAYRADPATGTVRWKTRREHENWSRLIVSPLVFMRTADNRWGAYEIETGVRRWEFRRDFGHQSFVDTTVNFRVSPVAVIQGWNAFNYDTRVGEGPAAVWGVDIATGTVRWKVTRIGDSPISDINPWSNQAVAVQDEKTSEWHLIKVADGSIIDLESTPESGAPGVCQVRYFRRGGKRVACVDGNGATVWIRRGPISDRGEVIVASERGYVVRPGKDGTVEVIRLTDGTSLYTTQGMRDPLVYVVPGGRYILVPAGRTMKIITVGD